VKKSDQIRHRRSLQHGFNGGAMRQPLMMQRAGIFLRTNGQSQNAFVGIEASLRGADHGGKWNRLGGPSQFHAFSRAPKSSHQPGKRELLQDFCQISLRNSSLGCDLVRWRQLSGRLLGQENQCLNGDFRGAVKQQLDPLIYLD